MANSDFLNGVFIKKKPEGQYGPWYNMWVPDMAKFIEELQNLPLDEKGGINFTISEQKADNSKMSVKIDTYKSQNQVASAPAKAPAGFKPVAGTAKNQAAPAGKKLPF